MSLTEKELIITRLKELYADSGVDSVSAFARLAGIDQSLMSKYLEGKRDFTTGSARTMMEKLKVNPKWIMSGEAPKYVQNNQDKQGLLIDYEIFKQLIAEKEARRLDAEERAKQARADLMDIKEEKKELMTIIKENLTALLISSNAARQDLAKILLVNRVDDGKIMDNQDIAAGREVGSSAKEAGMLELTTEVAASLENRKQTEKGKRVRVRK